MSKKPSVIMNEFISSWRKKHNLPHRDISDLNKERLDGLASFKREGPQPIETRKQAIQRLTTLKKTLTELADQLDDMPTLTWVQMTSRCKDVSGMSRRETGKIRLWAEAAQDGIDAIKSERRSNVTHFSGAGRKTNHFASFVTKKIIEVYMDETGMEPPNTEPTARENREPSGFFGVVDGILQYYGVRNADVWYLTKKNKGINRKNNTI
ncbi:MULTISPECIES: hypothetical protein [Enterobacteriaceae]|jgi:hypothetical protein|uniref:hypothetical protein n=1 Tax=Enterobacteriaceae TaxID=543 RepID=UPI0008FBB8C7|nr:MULTISPECIES: hypothetical protein [Enterobacteriaceae]MVX97341.1 hypothetical protein [Enterobacteriaceae bacterium 8376wB9]MVY09243.1 hypothetical protein [Enterobacteriaceae bacterium 8376wH8]HBU5927089.1 hypothetical protein [Klebsiella quasipneumoniae subsp. quasipneumoniae]HDS9659889.1 hypothetical protein [Klebsiella pneumoniae subsp. pneumoniae]EHC4954156.1 hypothetical protein [Escherichia coli]